MSISDAPVPPIPAPSMPAASIPTMAGRLAAETAGTFLLVFGLTATAIFSAEFPGTGSANTLGVGFFGVAAALGLTVMIGAYAFGPISGGHFNPAVSLGLAAAGRFAWRDLPGYVLAQFVGGILGASAVFLLSTGSTETFHRAAVEGGFVSNGFGAHSPGGFGLGSAIAIEILLTGVFVTVILAVTHERAAVGFAPIAIGLTLTLLLLVAIPIDNASLNPARSLATAIYGGGDWLAQLWVFLVFPVVGALIAGVAFRFVFETSRRR